ncbi:glycerate kinase [Leptospira venezuelensis]|uniref:glycerate kinase n=1 Tax=Leptospira venezuelensis TaxID=1958811 RepID=UPI000A376049|nr:glycerate kinase [Leptospira venezuelensis]
MRYKRILITPDKFKGTLSAVRVARAMSVGIYSVWGETTPIVELPLADGGEGSLVALHSMRPKLKLQTAILPDACKHKRSVCYLTDEISAYFESARLFSLNFRGNRQYPILDRMSSGIGRWVQQMLVRNKQEIFLFLGGTAICDGGLGILFEFGFQLLDGKGRSIHSLRNLPTARTLIPPQNFISPKGNITLLTDVTNPLVGPTGAPQLFAPQKGASKSDVSLLEDGLGQLSILWAEFSGRNNLDWPNGVGAGGGIALPFLGMWGKRATLKSGSHFFLEESGLAHTIREGDLVLTGEGRTDAGTISGKLVDAVVRLCRQKGADCLIISGSVSDRDRLKAENYPQIVAVSSDGVVPSRKTAAIKLSQAVSRAFDVIQ